MLSPSMSTALPDIRQTFHMNFVVTIIALVSDWSMSVVHVILPCMMWLPHPSGTALPKVVHALLCCVFLAEFGLIPFNLELTFTSFPLQSVRTSHTPSLTHRITHTLAIDKVILLASVRHHGQGITLWPTARTPMPNGMRSNWDFLLGRSR